jgi:nucleoside-diphosphate-sugar epimerase
MASVLVTGATGFIGSAVVDTLVAQGHDVRAVVRTDDGARRIREAGARPVAGDLRTPGAWCDEVGASQWVFHVATPSAFEGRLSRRRGAAIARDRVAIDRHVLDAVAGSSVRRLIYVSGASYYGPSGSLPRTEDSRPAPYALGRLIADAYELVDRAVVLGVPVVSAFPGFVYGRGSWFDQSIVKPLAAGRPIVRIGARNPKISPIHVRDCARALVHLAEHGRVGGRYFVVNDEPTTFAAMMTGLAEVMQRPARTIRVPACAAPLLVGPFLAEYHRHDAVFSNARLRAHGFRFEFPTIAEGLREVAGGCHA